ncbi:multi-sensor hybrid histidine kinase, partial [Candidatus Magnetomorum sp. HK-1]
YQDTIKSQGKMEKLVNICWMISTIGSILGVFLGVIIAFAMNRSLSKPINNLLQGINKISDGNMDFRVNVPIKDEIGQVATAFNSMADKIQILIKELHESKKKSEQASMAKGTFLSNMSHEIRTPMNAVIGLTSLALKTDLTSKQMDYLVKIKDSADALLCIINDILDYSKIEAGKMDIECIPFDINDMLANISNIVQIKAEEKNLELFFATNKNVPPGLIGDPLRLSQILINLINNAIKFTEKGQVAVSTKLLSEYQEKNKSMVILRFMVSDTGIGMTKDEVGRLFQSFTQIDKSITRKYGGTGLGLSICKNLVEMMGGKITIESNPGHGSTFTFNVKLQKQESYTKKQWHTPKKLTGINVLVVDDNSSSREILTDLLESFSFVVTQASSGGEAIKIVKKNDTDNPIRLILMDKKMPGMDGIEATRCIKKEMSLSQVPAILMVTAYGREEVRKLATNAGIDAFLLKPINASVLFNSIMEVMGEIESKTPLISQDNSEAHEIEKLVTHIRGAKILLAEDNEINQQVATEMLEYEGFDVTIANNGREAINLVKNNEFDAVLMDIQMPEMDGLTATKRIREFQTISSKIPIIAMTAHAIKGEKEKYLETGMDDYISKPVDNIELFKVLSKWIKHRGTQDTNSESTMGKDTNEKDRIENANIDTKPFEIIEGIDIKTALKRLRNNHKFFKKILFEFTKKYDNAVHDFKEKWDKGDTAYCARLAHSIKGVAGNISAHDLEKAAKELELALKQDKIENLDHILIRFEQSLNVVTNSINKLKNKENLEANDEIEMNNLDQEIDLSQVETLIKSLISLVNEYDSDAINEFLQLKDLLIKDSKYRLLLNQLETEINSFQFDEAHASLLKLSKLSEGGPSGKELS